MKLSESKVNQKMIMRPSPPFLPSINPCITQFHLLPLELVLFDGKGAVEEILLLLGVHLLEPRGDRRAGLAARVHDVLAVVVLGMVEQGLDARLNKAPCTCVEGLLLRPDNGLGVGVHVEVLAELVPRERVELLDAGEGDVFGIGAEGLAVLVQGGPDLARAEDHALNLVRRRDGAGLVLRVRDDPLELRVFGKLANRRAGERMAQEGLGKEDNEGWRC